MHFTRRHALFALAFAPVGCAIQPLSPLRTDAVNAPASALAGMRPPQVGHAWSYRKINHFNSQTVATLHETVASVGSVTVIERQEAAGAVWPAEQHGSWGQVVREPVWDYPLNLEQAVPLWPTNLAAGQQQSVHTHYREDGGSFRYWIQVYAAARGWERLVLPVGTFNTLRVERLVRLAHRDFNRIDTLRRDVMWLAPELGRWVVRVTSGRYREADGDQLGGSEYLEDHHRWELTAWR